MSKPEEKKVTRRGYLKTTGAAAAALVLGAAIGYVAKPTVTAPPTAVTSTVTVTGTAPPPPPVAGPIKIGYVGPLSPPGSYIAGTEMKHAAEMAVGEINAAGGLLGRNVELVAEDTMGTPDKGVAAFEKMITFDKVVAITGEFHSSVALAEIEVAHKYGIPYLDADAGSDKITGLGYNEVFRVGAPHSQYALTTVDLLDKLRKDGKVSRIAGIPDDTEGGQTVWKYNKLLLDRLSPPFPYSTETVELTTKDFVPTLLKLKAETPRADVLWACIASPSDFLLIKQAADTGLWPTVQTPLFLDNGSVPEIGVEGFWETVGKRGIGAVSITYSSPRIKLNPVGDSFRKRMMDEYGTDPTSSAYEEYDCMLALCDAIKRAGSTEPSNIISALETTKIDGTRFTIQFETLDAPEYTLKHQVRRYAVYVQWNKVGQKLDTAPVVWPPKYATDQIMWPPFPTS